MLKDHYQINPNDPPTAQSLILTEADALLSFWPDVRDDDELGSDEAFNLLSVWGHLRRFTPISLDSALTERFNSLIENEREIICRRAMEIEFPADWMDVSVQLEETWDLVTDHNSTYEIGRCVREQFKTLDRASLMVYSIEKLLPAIVSHGGFIALKNSVNSAEDFLADHPYVFLSAAVFASAMLDSYRVDLDGFDYELAETSLKHRILQGLIDEQQSPSKPVAIPHEVMELLIKEFTDSEERDSEARHNSEDAPIFGPKQLYLDIDTLEQRVELSSEILSSGAPVTLNVWLPDSLKGFFLDPHVKIELRLEANRLNFWLRYDANLHQQFSWTVKLSDHQKTFDVNGKACIRWSDSHERTRVGIFLSQFGQSECVIEFFLTETNNVRPS